MPLPPKLQERLDDLALFPDRQDRIEALIAIAEEFENPPPEALPRTEERRVPECESEVFVAAEPLPEGRVAFRIAVDNPQGISAMALARILEDGLSGERAELIRQVPDEIVFDIFGRELSMGKSMGLVGTLRKVKAEAARGGATRSSE
jgi:cysteine desulfuration protein SufE